MLILFYCLASTADTLVVGEVAMLEGRLGGNSGVKLTTQPSRLQITLQ